MDEQSNKIAWVIDDDADFCSDIANFIENSNGFMGADFTVEKFYSVGAAREKLKSLDPEQYPDFISCDGSTTSKGDGFRFATELAEKGIGVIVVSGDNNTLYPSMKHAAYMNKGGFDRRAFYDLAKEVILTASQSKEGTGPWTFRNMQQSPHNGGRY